MIALFTDFGYTGPYVGQMHAVLARDGTPGPVIDLMHDAPRFDPVAAAHMLAAAAAPLPRGTVFVGVIDPGVGTPRQPVIVEADGQRYVGPDNGLFDVVSARADSARWWRITRPPETSAATFHGRDLFAPVAGMLARGEPLPGEAVEPPHAAAAADDHGAIIHIDGFGNAVTGLRAPADPTAARLQVAGHILPAGRTFADVAPGDPLWFVNSMGLVEVAINRGSAAAALDLSVGTAVNWSHS